MRVLMVSANTEQVNMTVLPLGMACVASAVEYGGHDILLRLQRPHEKRG
ncbi:MAG: hypothetical protein KGY38_02470 [Desulfobacterales bacterium]|nr:hypothetical protein [Desulfobacterales bacterium]